jgi:hypothetical protein
MKIKMMKIFALVVIEIFIFNPNSSTYAAEKDNSLSASEYYKLGIPKKIVTLTDVSFSVLLLNNLPEPYKGALPLYNSKKSGIVFKTIFSEKSIDNIIKISPNYHVAQYALASLTNEFESGLGTYITNKVLKSEDNMYSYEICIIQALELYSMARSLKLLEDNTDIDPLNNDRKKYVIERVDSDLACLENSIKGKLNVKLTKEELNSIAKLSIRYLNMLQNITILKSDIKLSQFNERMNQYVHSK